MGNFSNNVITDVGKMLLADVQAGAVFTPTRIVVGSGTMIGGATTQSMTAVITPVKSIAINKKQRTPDGKCIFGGVYTNEEVTAPFYFRELALYAKAVYLNADGSVKSEGAETLYSYGNAGTTADYMPAYSTSTVVEKQIDLITWVGNDAQVDLTIETGVYVTQEQAVLNMQYINPDTVGFDSLLEYMVSIYDRNIIVSGHISGFSDMPEGVTILHGTINVVGGQLTVFGTSRTHFYFRGTNSLTQWTSKWQQTAPGGYGLGSDSTLVSNCDDAMENGWYYVNEDTLNRATGVVYGALFVLRRTSADRTQLLFDVSNGAVVQRNMPNGVWQPWEWISPPFGIGVEYRTIEHRDGKAVFKRLDADGVLRYRLDGETTWRTYANEVNAVSKTGDTMTGDLSVKKSAGPTVHIVEENGAGGALQLWNNVLSLSNKNSTEDLNNYRLLSLANAKSEPDIVHALVLSNVTNGVQKYYTVLHAGNMAAFGLGVVPASVE